jgi:Metallo-beta-lactamase superfamily
MLRSLSFSSLSVVRRKPVQGGEELFDPRVRDAIPERLALATIRHESLHPHLGQVLGQRRLGQADGISKRVHVCLAPIHQLAKDHEAPLIRERAQHARNLAGVLLHHFDYDHNAGEVDTRSVEAILRMAEDAGYTIVWTLETHAHADHLSGSPYIKAKTGAKIGIGEHIKEVQRIFRPGSMQRT